MSEEKQPYKRPPHNQIRVRPGVFRALQELARRNRRTAPLENEGLIVAACDAAGIKIEPEPKPRGRPRRTAG